MNIIRKHFIHLSVTFVIILSMVTSAWAATAVGYKLQVKGNLPQGVVVKNNMVTVKKGYVLKKVSKSRVNVMALRRGGNGITGSFDCTCNGNDGGCDVITTPTSVSCALSTCKSSCYMITTIPGSSIKGYIYRIK